jgi:hypothetical protein
MVADPGPRLTPSDIAELRRLGESLRGPDPPREAIAVVIARCRFLRCADVRLADIAQATEIDDEVIV